MNSFDRAVTLFFNHTSQRWPAFDQVVVFVSGNDLLKGGVVLAVFWGGWFYARNEQQRSLLLAGLAGALLALLAARVLAHTIPLRLRPVLDPTLGFLPPSGLPSQSNWGEWSSFPSDHASMFFALAFAVWTTARRLGALLLLYVTTFIFLPRIYTGVHYATDILAGCAVAGGMVALLGLEGFRARWAAPILAFEKRRPAWFYGALFLLTFQMATLFWDVRVLLSYFDFAV